MPNSTGVYQDSPYGFEMWCYDQLPRELWTIIQQDGSPAPVRLSELAGVGGQSLYAAFIARRPLGGPQRVMRRPIVPEVSASWDPSEMVRITPAPYEEYLE